MSLFSWRLCVSVLDEGQCDDKQLARRVDKPLLEPKKRTHGREAMRSHRMIRQIIALMAALTAAAPAAARANPLLSGYGGPGQGSQAILGATLLNGPSSGGGSGSSSGGGSIGPPGSSTGAAATGTPGGHASGHSSSTNAARHVSTARGTRADGAVSPAALRGSGSLGLSGTDVVYIILALGALGFTGALTRRLTQTTPRRPGT